MTEEEREKLINDMEIAILKEGVGTILHSSQLSRMARAALAVAEEAISKDSRARIAELEVENAELSTRCQAMFSLLPDETKIGDIQKAVAALKGERG